MNLKNLSDLLSKNDGAMVLYFFVEILAFFLSGFTLANKDYVGFIFCLLCGLFLAFILGEAIKFKERRING